MRNLIQGGAEIIGHIIINKADVKPRRPQLGEFFEHCRKDLGFALLPSKEEGVVRADMVALSKAVLHENRRSQQYARQSQ